MVAMRGVSTFLVARYIVFGLFTICNAITCSIAVWNYSLALYTQPSHVDIYLISLGAFSLLSIFTLIFVELLCVNALTTPVWFECGWVTLFWLMELGGGAALIAIESDIPCSGQTTALSNAVCTPERVLLAFTWMCTIILLVYLLTLVFISVSHYVEDPKIWVSDVRSLRKAAVRQSSLSSPISPLATRFKKRPSLNIYIPHPPRLQPPQTFARPAGLSTDYKIEPFRPAFTSPEQMDIPHSSNLPEATPLPPTTIISSFSNPIPSFPKERGNVRALPIQPDMPLGPVSSIEYANSSRPSGPVPTPGESTSPQSPSPLGDWPRRDVMQIPGKPKRKALPPRAFEFPRQHQVTMAPTDRASVPADTITQPRPRRPSGPRQRAPSADSGHQPTPLDLYGIRL